MNKQPAVDERDAAIAAARGELARCRANGLDARDAEERLQRLGADETVPVESVTA